MVTEIQARNEVKYRSGDNYKKKTSNCHSCRRRSALTYCIILQRIKIFQIVNEIKKGDEVKIWIRGGLIRNRKQAELYVLQATFRIDLLYNSTSITKLFLKTEELCCGNQMLTSARQSSSFQ